MSEHLIRETGSFIAGNLVYTGFTRNLADCLENGLPKKDTKRVFGNPHSLERVVRLGMLTNRSQFRERIKFGSCLLPQFTGKESDHTFGIALDTAQLLNNPRFSVRAVGLGFKEEALISLFGIQHGEYRYPIPIDTSEDLVGLIDEVHLILANEKQRIDPQVIRGVLVKEIRVEYFPLIDRFAHIPFFNQHGRLLR